MGERNVGGLRCGEVLGLLDRYVDGALDGDELAAVQAHVRGCEHCSRFGGAYARVVAALRATSDEGPPPSVVDRLAARLRAEES